MPIPKNAQKKNAAEAEAAEAVQETTQEAAAEEVVETAGEAAEEQVAEPGTEAEPAAEAAAESEAAAAEPAATEPAAEPAATEPAATEPAATEPAATEPAAKKKSTTKPAAAKPSAKGKGQADPATDGTEGGATTATKPAAKKKQAAGKAAEGEVDLLVGIVASIENLNEEEALSQAAVLLNNVDESYFRLGGILALIQTKNFWENHGYETFKAFIHAEYGLQYRKAMYLIQIYNDLVESNVEWAKVAGLGWTKLKELSPILNQDNVDELVAKAQSMTVLELIEYIKSLKGTGNADDTQPATPSNPVTTMTFKVHTDQKEVIRATIDKAKEDYGTEYDAVALEHICQAYATGGKGASKALSLEAMIKSAGLEKVLEVFEKVFPEVDMTVSM